MQTPPLGGWGPWFCALLCDSNSDDSYVVAHTMPHLAEAALGDNWNMIIKVGPFSIWQACEAYCALWSTYTGQGQRIKHGLCLFDTYHGQYELCIWWTVKEIRVVVVGGDGSGTLSVDMAQLLQSYKHMRLSKMSIAEVLVSQDILDPPKKRKKATLRVGIYFVVISSLSLFFLFFFFCTAGAATVASTTGTLSGCISVTKLSSGM